MRVGTQTAPRRCCFVGCENGIRNVSLLQPGYWFQSSQQSPMISPGFRDFSGVYVHSDLRQVYADKASFIFMWQFCSWSNLLKTDNVIFCLVQHEFWIFLLRNPSRKIIEDNSQGVSKDVLTYPSHNFSPCHLGTCQNLFCGTAYPKGARLMYSAAHLSRTFFSAEETRTRTHLQRPQYDQDTLDRSSSLVEIGDQKAVALWW